MEYKAVKKAVKICGSQSALAKRIGETPHAIQHGLSTTQSAISRWEKVPAEFVIPVEQATDGKVPRYKSRPDIYPIETTQQAPH